jgi:hypothetical protein
VGCSFERESIRGRELVWKTGKREAKPNARRCCSTVVFDDRHLLPFALKPSVITWVVVRVQAERSSALNGRSNPGTEPRMTCFAATMSHLTQHSTAQLHTAVSRKSENAADQGAEASCQRFYSLLHLRTLPQNRQRWTHHTPILVDCCVFSLLRRDRQVSEFEGP